MPAWALAETQVPEKLKIAGNDRKLLEIAENSDDNDQGNVNDGDDDDE